MASVRTVEPESTLQHQRCGRAHNVRCGQYPVRYLDSEFTFGGFAQAANERSSQTHSLHHLHSWQLVCSKRPGTAWQALTYLQLCYIFTCSSVLRRLIY